MSGTGEGRTDERPESVEMMLSDDRAATAPLDEFRAAYEADDNVWWASSCGHHQNVFEDACDEIDRLCEENERLRQIWPQFTERIGMGGVTEPGASPDDVADVWEQMSSDARDHIECPQWCDDCGWWEAPRSCEACKGSGYGGPLRQSIENVQGWIDCERCAGDGREHAEYTLTGDRPITDTQADLAAARAENERARANALREAADEVHTEARWQLEQAAMFTPGSSHPAEHGRAADRFLMVERILRDRAAALSGPVAEEKP